MNPDALTNAWTGAEKKFGAKDAHAVTLPCDRKNYFIAIADRPVRNLAWANLYHYSLEFWVSDSEVPLYEELKSEKFREKYPGSSRLQGVELLSRDGWEAWVYKIAGRAGYQWITENVKISVIYNTSTATSIMPIYQGTQKQIEGQWQAVMRSAREYAYAEQSGDYAYAEHFSQEPGSTYNRTNVARTQQDITLWIRPVVPANGLFATRGAVYFLDRLVKQGIPAESFELSRRFLLGYTRLWEQTDQRRLGYAIDALFYGTPDFLEQYRAALGKMTPESVHAAVKRQLRPEALNYAFVTQDADGLVRQLREPATPSAITYASPKAPELLQEDQRIGTWSLGVRPEAIRVVPASDFMQK